MWDRQSLCIVYLSLLGATACTNGGDLLLGHVEAMGDAGSDQEQPEDDAGNAPSGQVGTDPDAYRTCESDIAGKPKVELYVADARGSECGEAPCTLHTEQLRVADDGSVWIAASMDSLEKVVWVGHFDGRGTKLGASIVHSNGGAPLLAVDDYQRGWVVAGDFEHRFPSTLYVFEPNLDGAGGVTLDARVSDMIRFPNHGILLSDYRHGLVGYDLGLPAGRTFSWRELWASDSPPAGVLAVDDGNRIVRASRKQSDDRRSEWVVLDWFADGGALLSDRGPVQLGVAGSWLIGNPMVVAANNQLSVAYASLPYPRGGQETLRIEHLDEAGAAQWRWQLPRAGTDTSLAVDPITGSILTFSFEPGHGTVLVAISPDGESCRRFAIDGPNPHGFLALGPAGEIWFSAEDSFGSSFGRLERPDLRW